MELLDEIKKNDKMFKSPNRNGSNSPSPGKNGTWSFIENSPHSIGGKLPFIGGAKQ